MKQILVLTDLSEVAYNAMEYAFHLAKQMRVNLVLLHALETPEQHQLNRNREELNQWSLVSLNRIAIGKDSFRPTVKIVVKEDGLELSVKELLEQEEIDMMIIGATDGKNLAGFLFGDRVRKIITWMRCPMLIVPESVTYHAVETLFYVTDIRYNTFNIVRQVVHFAGLLKAKVAFMHSCNEGLPDLDYQTALSIFQEDISSRVNYPLRYLHNTKAQDVTEVIRQLLDETGHTILTMPLRKYHFFQHVFTSTPKKEAVIYKHLPLLIIPDAY